MRAGSSPLWLRNLDPYTSRLKTIGLLSHTVSARILHIRWYDFVSNSEVLRRTGLLAASSIVRKRRLGLFGHVARLTEDVPANQILRTCCEAQDGARPSPEWKRARGRPPITWIHQICRDTGISVTDALQLAEDRSFSRQIATAECYG